MRGIATIGLLVGIILGLWAGGATGAPAPPLDISGRLEGGTAMASVREVFTYLGFTSEWDGARNTISLRNSQGTLEVKVGSSSATWRPAKGGTAVRMSIARPARMASGVVVGPVASLIKAAGLTCVGAGSSKSGAQLVVGGSRTINIHYGAAAEPATPPRQQPKPDAGLKAEPELVNPATIAPWLEAPPPQPDDPQLAAENKSDSEVKIHVRQGGQGWCMVLPPNSKTDPVRMSPGKWAYMAVSSGTDMVEGEETFEPGRLYTWTWWVQKPGADQETPDNGGTLQGP